MNAFPHIFLLNRTIFFITINIWIVRTIYRTSKRLFLYIHSLHGTPNKLQTPLLKTKWSRINSMTYNIVIVTWNTHIIYIYVSVYLYIYNSSWFNSITKFQHPCISLLVHLQYLFSHSQVFQGYLKQRMRINDF